MCVQIIHSPSDKSVKWFSSLQVIECSDFRNVVGNVSYHHSLEGCFA